MRADKIGLKLRRKKKRHELSEPEQRMVAKKILELEKKIDEIYELLKKIGLVKRHSRH